MNQSFIDASGKVLFVNGYPFSKTIQRRWHLWVDGFHARILYSRARKPPPGGGWLTEGIKSVMPHRQSLRAPGRRLRVRSRRGM